MGPYSRRTARGGGPCPEWPPGGRLACKLLAFSGFAASLSTLSTCRRAQVGCLLATCDLAEVLSVGYNGPPAGRDNQSCRGTAGSCGCVHAEANALVKLRAHRVGLVMVTTRAPCEHCAGLVLNCGSVDLVLYRDDYRDSAGLELLGSQGVAAFRWPGQ